MTKSRLRKVPDLGLRDDQTLGPVRTQVRVHRDRVSFCSKAKIQAIERNRMRP